MPEMKRSIKDSVFTLMFKEPEYALQLYQVLHPEDTDVTEADCRVVTLENVLTVGQYNDLGLQVRDTLLLLTEAQSVFTLNIAPRMLMYVANSYKEYVEEHKLDLYGSKPVKLPRPELYVVYTGSKPDVPNVIRLSDLYEGEGSVDIHIRVIRRTGTGDILDQYVRFCEIVDTNRMQYGRTAKAIEETLRQCREENILTPFLASRQKEVHDIMVTLFNQEQVLEIHDYNVAKEAEAKGMEMNLLANLKALMKKLGYSAEEAMDTLGVPSDTRIRLQGQL